ncbi:MAG TPA: ABC transporter ATP-binding protein [Geminicoccaceae bacterium]|nr:ABC transporter ATP-binding protein [Geminicoccaceae bacterium]
MIEVESLDVRFGAFHAVRDVSFRVPAGEAFGLVGESGSGKTTVLKAIAGLIGDSGGRITVDGETLGTRRSPAFCRKVQMIFQDPYGSLHPRHTVDRTLSEPLAIHGLGDVAGRVERTLRAVGLGSGFRYRYPHQLSGGQRQRIAIARALMLEPKILLLDEPTSSLDVSVQAEILNLLAALRRERGLTYLFVSHNLAVIAHMCGEVAVMNAGRIVEQVATSALAAGALANPYAQQLLRSSKGYDRQVAARLVSYD